MFFCVYGRYYRAIQLTVALLNFNRECFFHIKKDYPDNDRYANYSQDSEDFVNFI